MKSQLSEPYRMSLLSSSHRIFNEMLKDFFSLVKIINAEIVFNHCLFQLEVHQSNSVSKSGSFLIRSEK